MEVLRKPVLQHVVEEMQAAGARNLVMITSESKETIKEHFSVDTELEKKMLDQGKNDLLDALQFLSDPAPIICVNQAQQKGLGDAVYCARESIGDQSFLIALGDTKMGDDIPRGGNHSKCSDQNSASLCLRMIACFERTDADVAIAFQEVSIDKVGRYGIAEPAAPVMPGEEFFHLSGIIEKPVPEHAPSRYAVAARYICKPVIFEYLARTPAGLGGEIQLTDAIQELIEEGGRVIGVPLQGLEKRYDVGNYESYFTAFIELALNDPQCGDAVQRHVKAMMLKLAER